MWSNMLTAHAGAVRSMPPTADLRGASSAGGSAGAAGGAAAGGFGGAAAGALGAAAAGGLAGAAAGGVLPVPDWIWLAMQIGPWTTF